MNKKKCRKIINHARNRRKLFLSNLDKNTDQVPDTTDWDQILEKRFGGMPYNHQKKRELDNVLGKDSMNLLSQRLAEHFMAAIDNCSDAIKRLNRKQKRDVILQDLRDRINSCKIIKYIAEELELPNEYSVYYLQNMKDILEEMLGLRDFKKLVFDNRYPVQLLWESGCYKIKHNEKIYDLNCETEILFGDWAFCYYHFEEISPWNNGTFSIIWNGSKRDHPNDWVSISLDHYTLFEEYFEDEMLYASDIGRMVELFTREYNQEH